MKAGPPEGAVFGQFQVHFTEAAARVTISSIESRLYLAFGAAAASCQLFSALNDL